MRRILAVVAAAVSLAVAPPQHAPVVVELFTSQGCSSCPPADALLGTLANDPRVIPLAFHVDYWDHLGWSDPFSSRDWSERQARYVRTMRLDSAYTPQAVVGGSEQLVGSNRAALQAAIDRAWNRGTRGSIDVIASREPNAVSAHVRADVPPGHDLYLAIAEASVTTRVEGGENGGRTLRNDAIVRRLLRIGPGDHRIPVDARWHNLTVAVFAQDRKSLAIDTAASARVP